jgi:hypothetical protein
MIGFNAPAQTTIIDGIVYPGMIHPADIISSDYNTWLSPIGTVNQVWNISRDGRTVSRKDDAKDYKFSDTCVCLVPSSFTRWFSGHVSDRFVFNNLGDRYWDEVKVTTATIGTYRSGRISCVRFIIDFTRQPASSSHPSVEIWYDNDKRGQWTFTELGLPTNEAIYPAIMCGHDSKGVTIDAPLPRNDATLSDLKWGERITDYELLERLGTSIIVCTFYETISLAHDHP